MFSATLQILKEYRSAVHSHLIRDANYYVHPRSPRQTLARIRPGGNRTRSNYASKLQINQVRVFLSYPACLADKSSFQRNLGHLAHAWHERGIELMPVVTWKKELIDEAEECAYAQDLVDAIGTEPGLACWDVCNEPDLPEDGAARTARIEPARITASVFRELDPHRRRTPIVIAWLHLKLDHSGAAPSLASRICCGRYAQQ